MYVCMYLSTHLCKSDYAFLIDLKSLWTWFYYTSNKLSGYRESLQLLTGPSLSLGFTKPNKCMGPLGLHSMKPANRTVPFVFARQTPSGPEAIQKLDTTKAKTRSRLAESKEEADFDSQVLCSAWQPETKSSILILKQRHEHHCIFFFLNFCDLSCNIFPLADVLYCRCGFSAASRFNFTPSGLLRGIYVWWVMAGNFNAQLIMSQNKWGSSSTFHSQWQVAWVAELWICQRHAGLLETLEATTACACPKLRRNIGLFLSESESQYDLWVSCLVVTGKGKKRGTIYA